MQKKFSRISVFPPHNIWFSWHDNISLGLIRRGDVHISIFGLLTPSLVNTMEGEMVGKYLGVFLKLLFLLNYVVQTIIKLNR